MTGDALEATAEKGKEYHKRLIDNTVEVVLEIKAMKANIKGEVPLPF